VYGLIGGMIYRHLQSQPEKYDVYGLARRRVPSDRVEGQHSLEIPDDRLFVTDLTDLDRVRKAVEGMDIVVHMAANPNDHDPWDKIMPSNIVGAYHAFEACRQAGVKRIVAASSVMACWGYQLEEPYKSIKACRFEDVPDEIPLVTHRDPVRPTDLYPASKVWAEALARVYADIHGMSCICLRIGWVNDADRPYDPTLAAVWCSHRDIADLVERSVNASDELRFDIFFGVSDNQYRWVDIDHPRHVLGYEPRDRAEDRM
jgi:nucleoside-diphosphate-sugar epimerase